MDPDSTYFDSYSYLDIHRTMLLDYPRTSAYRRAITQNPHLFKDKLVLDIGCGSGVLSFFAVEAGAAHVFAVDKSSIISTARRVAESNGMSQKITFIQTMVENLIASPSSFGFPAKVDVIVSEWMGYGLLVERMLPSVIKAREAFLDPQHGLVLPDKARLYAAMVSDWHYYKLQTAWTDLLYGYSFAAMKELILQQPVQEERVDHKKFCTETVKLVEFDLMTVSEEELQFEVERKFKFKRNAFGHFVCCWFEVQFTRCHEMVLLSTAPWCEATHWGQVLYVLKKQAMGKKNESVKVIFRNRHDEENCRALRQEWEVDDGSGGEQEEKVNKYIF